MKINYNPTFEKPFNFFKKFYDEDVIHYWFFRIHLNDLSKDSYINEVFKDENEKLSGYIEYWCDDENQYKRDELLKTLSLYINREAKKSINIIDKNVLSLVKDSKDYKELLKFYLKELNNIESRKKDLIDSEESLIKPLIDLSNHINEEYLNGIKRKYIVFKDEKEKLIYSIFDYLGGENEDGNKILKESDYESLISYLKEFVDTGKVPIFKTKVPNLKGVDNLTLRRSFYTLYKKLNDKIEFPKKKIVKFMMDGLMQVKDSSEFTLLNLSKEPSCWKKFVPRIIKELS